MKQNNEMLNDYLEFNKSICYYDSIITGDLTVLNEFLEFNQEPLNQLTTSIVEDFIISKSYKCVAYIEHYLELYVETIGNFCNYLIDQGVIKKDIADFLKYLPRPLNIPEIFPEEVVVKLLASIPTAAHFNPLCSKAILEVLYRTGITQHELALLKMDDIDFDNLKLFIRGKDERVINLAKSTSDALVDYIELARPQKFNKPNDPLWIHYLNYTIYPSGFTEIINNCALKVGLHVPQTEHKQKERLAVKLHMDEVDHEEFIQTLRATKLDIIDRYIVEPILQETCQ